mgnify:CR=1 FL=1
MKPLSVPERLTKNRFLLDEEQCHIEVNQAIAKATGTGKLLVAGPFSDDGALRGMYVFNVATKEEAEALVKSDPAVQAGRLRFELHPWFAAKNIVVTPHAASPAAGR